MPEYSERALRKAQSSCALSSSFRGVSVVRTMRVRCARSHLEWKRSALINALISGPDTWPSLTQLFAIIALRRDGPINGADHDAGRAVLPMLPIFSACSDSRRRGDFVEHPPRCKCSRLCFGVSASRPNIGHSGCRYAILKAAIRYLPRPTPAEEKDNGIF